MNKPKITLREFLPLITPSGRVRVYEIIKQEENLLYEGFRSNLTHSNHSCLNREVQLVKLHPEFTGRKTEEKRIRISNGEILPVTPENAAEYNYADICMKLYTDIYVF